MYKIVSKDMLTPTICRMKVEAPRLASAAQPGQFLIVRADEQGERIPLTISDYDRSSEEQPRSLYAGLILLLELY